MHNLERNNLRAVMKQKRGELKPEEISVASQAVAGKLNQLVPLYRAQNIMGFCPIKNEVDVFFFLEGQRKQGKTILLPRINQEGELEAVRYEDENSLSPGNYGIPEPQGEPVQKIDAVLVPGLVFDGRGYRLGYGKGYYDRFLATLSKNVFVCGVCYEFQVVDNVFPQESDIPMHWVVTEKSELVIDWDFF
jgi:5-formyltetrahydrofolate cyclo-ligase